MVLAQLALAEYLAGRWTEAAEVADEASELALQTGQRPMQAYSLATRALVRASLGLEAEARADAHQALEFAAERGMAAARIHSVWALGVLELSLDRPAEAAQLLTPERERLLAAGVGEPGTIRFVPDEIEALTALGQTDEARAPLEWLEERGSALDRPSALAAAARSRGLLAAASGDGDAALAQFEEALAQHARGGSPFERARTLLAYGATQRRTKKKAAARKSLSEALADFEGLGAALWAAKARSELASIGGRSPSTDELTPAEQTSSRARRRGADEQRGGRSALRDRPHGRVPPLTDLQKARRPVARGARSTLPRLARQSLGVSGFPRELPRPSLGTCPAISPSFTCPGRAPAALERQPREPARRRTQ